jgi:hypothetical protein
MLYRIVERIGLHCLATVPEYFHNAHLYARELPYFDPWYMGQLRALEHLLLREHALSLAAASWAIDWGLVKRPDGTDFHWRGQLMLWPAEPRLTAYLRSDAHREESKRVARHERYTLDRAAFDARWAREHAALEGEAV